MDETPKVPRPKKEPGTSEELRKPRISNERGEQLVEGRDYSIPDVPIPKDRPKPPPPPSAPPPDTTSMRNVSSKAPEIILIVGAFILLTIAIAIIVLASNDDDNRNCYIVNGQVTDISQAFGQKTYITVERDGMTLIIPITELARVKCQE